MSSIFVARDELFRLKQNNSKCHSQGPVANDRFDVQLSEFGCFWIKAIFSTYLLYTSLHTPRYKFTQAQHTDITTLVGAHNKKIAEEYLL